jgi:tetratricopeptide (TPR) repeat protein
MVSIALIIAAAMKKSHQDIIAPFRRHAGRQPQKYSIRSSPLILAGIALIFFAWGFLLYSNTLHSPFIFDDEPRILENPDIRITALSLKSILKAAFGEKSARSRPLGNISFALNYYFHQYELPGYHIVNISVHVLAGLLLFIFIRMTLSLPTVRLKNGPAVIAISAAMLWFVNPVQTQSIVYIVQRLNSLAALFYILTLLLYLQGRLTDSKAKRRICFVGAAFGWILALACKQNAAMLPFFILLYEWYFFQDLSLSWLKRNLKYFFIILAVFLTVVFLFLGFKPLERLASITDFANKEFTLSERVMTQFRVVIYYLSLFFYPNPKRLSLDYDFPLSHSLIDPLTTVLSLGAILAMVALAVYVARPQRLLSFCLLWYFGNLLIESSIIPLAIIYEHRLYLPSMLIGLPIIQLIYKHIRPKWLPIGIVAASMALLSFWTYERNKVWQNEITLWRDCLEKFPNKARPHYNLGVFLQDDNNFDEAVQHYFNALRINPRFSKAHYNLGVIFARQEKTDQAVEHYLKSLEIDPNYVEAHSNLGLELAKQGKFDEAIDRYRKALQINPTYAVAYVNLGDAFAEKDENDEAVRHYLKALQIDPNFAKAHNNLGLVLIGQGKLDEAAEHYRRALQAKPDLAEAHNNLGFVLARQAKLDEAIEHYRQALEAKPDFAEAQFNLGDALAKQGKTDQSIRYFQEAVKLKPENAEAHNNLGGALLKQGRLDEALKHFEAALKIDPNLVEAHNNLGVILIQMGKLDAAIYHFQEAFRINPDFKSAEANLNRAVAIRKQMKSQTAALLAELENKPDDPVLYFELGNLFLGTGELGKAIVQFEKALAIQPNFPEAMNNLAMAYTANQQYDQALGAFTKMVALQPDNAMNYYNLAVLHALQNNVAVSLEWLKKAIAKGYDNWELIKTDKDLENIRNSAGYKELIEGR